MLAEIRQNTAETAARSLLAWIRPSTLSISVTCSAREFVGRRNAARQRLIRVLIKGARRRFQCRSQGWRWERAFWPR